MNRSEHKLARRNLPCPAALRGPSFSIAAEGSHLGSPTTAAELTRQRKKTPCLPFPEQSDGQYSQTSRPLLYFFSRPSIRRNLPPYQGAPATVINVPRSLRKRRRSTTLTGTVTSSHETPEIEWGGEDPRSKVLGHLVAIEGLLPIGSLYDHGIEEALKRAGINLVGTADIRNVANVLHRSETVQAVGTGRLRDRAGIVALTGRQLLFLEISNSEHFVGLPVNSIQALALGKKMTGETLTALNAPLSIVSNPKGYETNWHRPRSPSSRPFYFLYPPAIGAGTNRGGLLRRRVGRTSLTKLL